jgi:ABC-2 type transport system ATP-binding protein
MGAVVEVVGLSKVYKHFASGEGITALDNVSLSVVEGEVFALLGLNGAGKTSLIKIILDLVRPTTGHTLLFGNKASRREWKGQVGYLPEMFQPPKDYTSESLLTYFGKLSGLDATNLAHRINETLETVGLSEVRTKTIGSFSKGMVLRLGVAQAMLHKPRILFLDEPTDGMDPLGRKVIRELIVQLRREGSTVFLNSHLLSEVELIASRVAILNRGHVVVVGTLEELLPRDNRFEIEIDTDPTRLLPRSEFMPRGDSWIAIASAPEHLKRILADLDAHDIRVAGVRPVRTTLEDVFFSYIHREL